MGMLENIEKVKGTTKWSLTTIVVAVIAFVAVSSYLELLIRLAKNWVTLIGLGIVIMGLLYCIPAICEFLANLGWDLFEGEIRRSPVARLKRDVKAFREDIDRMETNIASANSQFLTLEGLLKKQRKVLAPDELQDWETQLDELRLAGDELIRLRDQNLNELREFERTVEKAEAQYNLGNAFNSALKSFKVAQGSGPGSEGSKIALDEVSKRLSESRSRLQVVLSRPMHLTKIGGSAPAALSSATGTTIEADTMNIRQKEIA